MLKLFMLILLSANLANAQTSVGGGDQGPDGIDDKESSMQKMKNYDEAISKVVEENSADCLGKKNKLTKMNLHKVYKILSDIQLKSSLKHFNLQSKKNILHCPQEEYEKIVCLVRGSEKDIGFMIKESDAKNYLNKAYKNPEESELILDFFRRIQQIPE